MNSPHLDPTPHAHTQTPGDAVDDTTSIDDPEDTVTDTPSRPDQADPADAWDQHQPLPEDDDDYGHDWIE